MNIPLESNPNQPNEDQSKPNETNQIPEQIPNPGPSNHDSSGSQSEEQPDSEPEDPARNVPNANPELVPIPNEPFSDPEDESILFCSQYDHWQREGSSLVRYHVELRNRMFCSSNVTDCPVPLSELSSTRQTYRDYDKFVGFEIA